MIAANNRHFFFNFISKFPKNFSSTKLMEKAESQSFHQIKCWMPSMKNLQWSKSKYPRTQTQTPLLHLFNQISWLTMMFFSACYSGFWCGSLHLDVFRIQDNLQENEINIFCGFICSTVNDYISTQQTNDNSEENYVFRLNSRGMISKKSTWIFRNVHFSHSDALEKKWMPEKELMKRRQYKSSNKNHVII